jgi:hypothetical protein
MNIKNEEVVFDIFVLLWIPVLAGSDHFGSVLSLTDNAGTAVFKASYDAWGKQTVLNNPDMLRKSYWK